MLSYPLYSYSMDVPRNSFRCTASTQTTSLRVLPIRASRSVRHHSHPEDTHSSHGEFLCLFLIDHPHPEQWHWRSPEAPDRPRHSEKGRGPKVEWPDLRDAEDLPSGPSEALQLKNELLRQCLRQQDPGGSKRASPQVRIPCECVLQVRKINLMSVLC